MSDNWEPTGRLRFVLRDEPTSWNPDQSGKSGMVSTVKKIRVLQQEWQQRWGHDTGPPEWRDVPLEEESIS